MFDAPAQSVDNSNLVSPRKKYYPKQQYTVPPKKVRGVDNGKTPITTSRSKPKKSNGSVKKPISGTAIAGGAIAGGAILGGAAYLASQQ
jgi:hypothetical protein